ncbi:hypothetical protein GJAV_G00207840 [Gymnothorax javanicus]|nr:hypothetical protein GJAV_G00207840 [Gymnothorax javanicus]
MAGDCTYQTHYGNDDALGNEQFVRNQEFTIEGILDTVKSNSEKIEAVVSSQYFEIIDGVLYRKTLEKGNASFREVLDRNRQRSVISAFHEEPPGERHLTLDNTYKTVADNYWWEGMYFHIREYVLGCQQCQALQNREEVTGKPRVSRTLPSHGNAVLCKLSSQREAGLFCDITLKTGNRSFPAHRAVLAAVSEYFQEIFTEMDSDGQPIIDLTGFGEESVLTLLEFSYTSTLCLSTGDLAEVCALAQHFRMWAAVEACRALQSEQSMETSLKHPLPTVTCKAEVSLGRRRRNEGRSVGDLDSVQSQDGCVPSSKLSNGAPCGRDWESPVRRLKLMDFKSPTSKVRTPAQNLLFQVQPVPEQGPLVSCALKCRQKLSWAEAGVEPGVEFGEEEDGQSSLAQEKYRLLSVLGLQRRSLLPRPEELTGWRQKRRLRKSKVSSYALTAPRKPRAPLHSNVATQSHSHAPAVATPILLPAQIKIEPPEPISMEEVRLGQRRGRGHRRSMLSAHTERRELRRSVRGKTSCLWNPTSSLPLLVGRKCVRVKQEPADPQICAPSPSTHDTLLRPRGRPRKYPAHNSLDSQSIAPPKPRGRPRLNCSCTRTLAPTQSLTPSLLSTIKEEPADGLPVTSATAAPLPVRRRQRQSKPPLKLLDPGFLFPLKRPVKQEEVGVAVWQAGGIAGSSGSTSICRSLCGARGLRREDEKQLRLKGPSAPRLRKRKVRHRLLDRGVSGVLPMPALLRANSTKRAGKQPKNLTRSSLQNQRSAALEHVRQARVKRLRQRRNNSPMTSHSCIQCNAVFRNCDGLIMHRIRHIEGKHWPCPLCSKAFFRQRNVQSHIRTHDPKLYKCSTCIFAS